MRDNVICAVRGDRYITSQDLCEDRYSDNYRDSGIRLKGTSA